MLVGRISRTRVVELLHMFCSPTVCGKASTVLRQACILIRIRTFCISSPTVQTESSQVNLTGYQVSRGTKAAARNALFEYFHCTRGLHSTDAEHISKNSPCFLKKLLSQVDNVKDESGSLSKYFSYNPINEFEPFLESLGLKPREFRSLLPTALMFLEEDRLMLDNYHVLCNYGIPRIKIGKMYKEAKEIFGYRHGILSRKLRDYEKLCLRKSTVIKMVTCCPSLLISDDGFLVVLEKLKGFGLGSEWIGNNVSEKITLNWNKMLRTINFLMQVGYSDEQMETLFKDNPAVLFRDPGKQIRMFVRRLMELGLKMDEVYELLKEPQILSYKYAVHLWKAARFLFEIGMERDVLASIVTTHRQVLGLHYLKGPVAVMNGLKLQQDELCEVIKKDPLQLINLASKTKGKVKRRRSETFMDRRIFLLRVGYVENSEELEKALKAFKGRGDQLQERFDCLVQAGLDYHTVSSMIKHAPFVLNQTKDMLEKKMDCLRNYLGYPLEAIVRFPAYVSYDMQRINIRFKMFVWLRERGVVRPIYRLSSLLVFSDARFVDYFVRRHPEGLAMWETLKTSFASR